MSSSKREEHRRAVPLDELDEALLGDVAAGDLSTNISQDLLRNPCVLGDDAEERGVGASLLVELQERDPQSLLVDLGGMDGVAARCDSAYVLLVRECRHEPHAFVADEDRLDHIEVGQVHAAGSVRIVQDEDVSRADLVTVAREQVLHRVRERADVERGREPLGQHAPVAVEDGCGVVEGVADERGVCCSHERDRCLVGKRVERALHDLERDRVG